MPESDDIKEVLVGAAAKADALRAAGLRGLEGISQARQARLEAEQGRLSGEPGAAHPRAPALAAKIQDGAARLREFKVDIARAEVTAPIADATKWILHGLVRGADLSPVPTVTVTLVDAQGQWLRALGFATTDSRGYFHLAAPTRGAKPAPTQPAASVRPPKLEAHIRITDRSRIDLYRGKETLLVSPGGVEYREIVLEGTPAPLPPEEDISGAARKKRGSPPKGGRKPRRGS